MAWTRHSADAAWRRAQPAVRGHADVSYDPARGTYRYGGGRSAAPALTGDEALDRLLPPRLTTRRAALAAVVRAALKERDDLEARLRAEYVGSRAMRAVQERQVRIDAVRALATVVSEVEELAAAGAGAGVTAERVRALAQAFGLAPIGRAGELTAFEPAWHAPIGVRPPDRFAGLRHPAGLYLAHRLRRMYCSARPRSRGSVGRWVSGNEVGTDIGDGR